jgi:hypothetical protein
MDKENKSNFRITFSEEVTYEVIIKAKNKAEALICLILLSTGKKIQ